MEIHPIPIDELTADDWAAWDALRASHAIEGPHSCPEFFRQVARVCRGVEAARFEEGGRIVGYLPYQRTSAKVGESVAGPFAEEDGLVGSSELPVDFNALLQACGLHRLWLRRWRTAQPQFAPFAVVEHVDHYLDLSSGFDAYQQSRRAAGVDDVQETRRKARKLEREGDPLRFEVRSGDTGMLRRILEWKFDQLRERRQLNPMRSPWHFDLLESLARCRHPDLEGIVAGVFWSDRMIGGAMLIRSGRVATAWLLAYDPEFRRLSPGFQVTVALAQAAQSLGIERIELGCGDEPYKRRLGSASKRVSEGIVATGRFATSVRQGILRTRDWLSRSERTRPVWNLWQACRASLAGRSEPPSFRVTT